jgi:hypothetical protein
LIAGCAPQAAQGGASALASRVVERARRRADRTSSRTPNHWQSLQPVFAIIIGDDCTLTAFSSPQPTFFDLRISRSAPDPVTLAKLVNAHRPLQRAALSLDF